MCHKRKHSITQSCSLHDTPRHTIGLPKPYRLLTQHQIWCECSLNPARSCRLFLLKGHSLVQPHSGLLKESDWGFAWSAGFQIWYLIGQAVRLTANSLTLQVYDVPTQPAKYVSILNYNTTTKIPLQCTSTDNETTTAPLLCFCFFAPNFHCVFCVVLWT